MTPSHLRHLAVTTTRSLAGPNGELTRDLLHDVATKVNVSPRTIRRWLATAGTEEPARRRPPWKPTQRQLAVISASVNLADAHRDLAANDPTLPSYHTFRRGVAACDPGVAAAVTRKGGAPALVKSRVYLKVAVPRRNQRWVMDSQEIPVWVLPPRGSKPIKAWQTTALDEATRTVMATVVTPSRPTSDDVVACIAAGIRGVTLDDGTFIGGVPDEIAWDNAGEFLSEQVTQMALQLAFTGTAVNPYAPYEKGKIESWHRTVQNELYAKLPGNSHGPRTFSGGHYWNPADTRQLLSFDMLVARALVWVEHYNYERPHSSLGGRAPLAVWLADRAGVRTVGDDALYEAMLRGDATRKVGKEGVRFHNIDYVDPGLNDLFGRRVEVRYMPHDDSHIEVFLDGEHKLTAYRADRLGAEQRSALMRLRHDQYATARALLAEGARLRRERYDNAVETGVAMLPPVSDVPAGDPRAANHEALLALMADETGEVEA